MHLFDIQNEISSELSYQKSKKCFMKPTDANEIRQIIMSLQPKKTSGYDNLSSCLLKLALGIPILINKSIVEGVVPDEL